jgi:excisionase family DNA binding protein
MEILTQGNPMISYVEVTKIPCQRLFGTKAAAHYLGIHEQTLRKLTDEGLIQSRRLGSRRVYLLDDLDNFIALDDLDNFIASLPTWYRDRAVPGEKGAANGQ